jgi:hypothetical protein
MILSEAKKKLKEIDENFGSKKIDYGQAMLGFNEVLRIAKIEQRLKKLDKINDKN